MKKIQELCRNYQEMIFRALGEGNAFEDIVSCYFEGIGRFCMNTKEVADVMNDGGNVIIRPLCEYKEDGSHNFVSKIMGEFRLSL